jgi:release factor glutamine methyltransferase
MMTENNSMKKSFKPVTVSQVVSRLNEAGICLPVVNAEIMLSCLLGLRTVDLYTNALNLTKEDSALLECMIARRINGEPVQYITGKTNFYGNDLIVRKGVFIPRPETEILVDKVINIILNTENRAPNTEHRILDLCAGSGNIAISLTKALTHCKIISSDISEAALSLVKENAEINKVSDRILCIKADFLSLPRRYKKTFDIIVCNPPYVRYADMESLAIEVKQDPFRALYGGIDGMDYYRRIAKHSGEFLKDKGLIALEIPDNSKLEVNRILNNSGNFADIRFFKDLNGIDRVVIAQLKVKSPTSNTCNLSLGSIKLSPRDPERKRGVTRKQWTN